MKIPWTFHDCHAGSRCAKSTVSPGLQKSGINRRAIRIILGTMQGKTLSADVLDNPIWFALSTQHESLALSQGSARRYPKAVSPFAALLKPTPDAFTDLQALVQPGERVALFTASPLDVPTSWQVDVARWIEQMTCETSPAEQPIQSLPLSPADVPEMLALTAATEPGPFLPGTIELGRYFGIRSDDGRLAAMAGERLRLSGFTEISAVCTHPDFRGRGYAKALVTMLAAKIMTEGKMPFLHVNPDNGAKVVYEKIGFQMRTRIRLTVISPQPENQQAEPRPSKLV
jgi:predicted GNAT family acetyltransferase